MRVWRKILPALLPAIFVIAMPAVTAAQQRGGVLQIAHRDSPASMSPLEEVTISTIAPMMAVFNNLVLFDQHVPRNTLKSIVPDLAENWVWSADGRELTFHLRRNVRWHDGQSFTARDVECTWNMSAAGISRPSGAARWRFSTQPARVSSS